MGAPPHLLWTESPELRGQFKTQPLSATALLGPMPLLLWSPALTAGAFVAHRATCRSALSSSTEKDGMGCVENASCLLSLQLLEREAGSRGRTNGWLYTWHLLTASLYPHTSSISGPASAVPQHAQPQQLPQPTTR